MLRPPPTVVLGANSSGAQATTQTRRRQPSLATIVNMLYLAHAYEPSAILQTLLLPSFLPTGPCLALVKHSNIEFLSLRAADDTSSASATSLLEPVQAVTLHARILAAQAITNPSSTQSPRQTLLVLTDHYQPKLISLSASIDPQTGEVVVTTAATLALDEVARSPAESALSVSVEPHCPTGSHSGQRVALAHVYKGIVKVVPLASSHVTTGVHAANHTDEPMDDVPKLTSRAAEADLSQSFGVRLPHPNLLSYALLSPLDATSNPSVALLSQSSVPSKIPGFGESCLPVLSFHSIDAANQDLSPLAWGAPRKPPRSAKEGKGDDKLFDSQSSTAATQSSRDVKASRNDDKASARKKHGPAAMGSRVANKDLRMREEEWAKTDLAQCHVPLPFADALGAHLIHALPASVGGGVLVFSETSILYVPPPANSSTSIVKADNVVTMAPQVSDIKGKRRKASEGGAIEGRRRSSGACVQEAPINSEDAPSTSLPSNENGKRRRSSNLVSPGNVVPSFETSASTPPPPKLLRISLPHPVQVVSVVDMDEPAQHRLGGTNTFAVLFGCSSGSLNVLRLTMPDESQSAASCPPQPMSMRVEKLGSTSQPAGPQALSYLGDGLVCVGSATGDSCLYKIHQQHASEGASASTAWQVVTPPSSPTQSRRRSSQAVGAPLNCTDLMCGGSLITVERWQNLGPVIDFVVDDGAGGDPTTSSSAQARIVTCSGAGPSGSVREVRSGASVQDLSSLPIPNAQHLWPIHAGDDRCKQTVGLLVGFATSTAYLQFDTDGNLVDATDRLAAAGMDTSISTLAASTVVGNSQHTLFLRVARTGASLLRIENDSVTLLEQWIPPEKLEITTASTNQLGQLVIALSDKKLSYFVVEGCALKERKKIQLEHEVSCLDVSSLVAGKAAQIIACGLWQARTVQIFSLPELSPVGQSSVVQQSFPAVPRSILLHQFSSKKGGETAVAPPKTGVSDRDALSSHLLIGFGDGTLVTFSLSLPTDDSYSSTVGLSDSKTVILGTQALKLDAIETSSGTRAVAVSGGRPTLVYADSKRFSYSMLKHKDQRGMATLYAGPECVFNAFALANSIELASIGALKQRDIRTFPLGLNQPLAIAQWPNRQVFAVCTWTFLPCGTASKIDASRGAIHILDQTTFETLDEIRLEPDERPNCITVLRAQGHEMLVVGTGLVSDDTPETTSGRLVGYDVSIGSSRTKEERGRLRRLFTHKENGNVYSVQSINNRLAAAVNSEVKIYSIVDPRESDMVPAPRINVKQRGSWACSFIACSLSVIEPDRIVVGDALRSMNVLHVHPYTARITEIARDCDPFWTSATELLDDASQTYIGADISFNLYTTQRVALSEEVKTRIRRAREQETERSVRTPNPRTIRGPEEVDRYAHVMQRNAVWHYGDMINKFIRSKFAKPQSIPTQGFTHSPHPLSCSISQNRWSRIQGPPHQSVPVCSSAPPQAPLESSRIYVTKKPRFSPKWNATSSP